METCPYCATSIQKDNQYYCSFCLMYIHNVQRDGKREIIEYREHTSELDLDKSTPELMTLPTIELFHLLRLSRKIRKQKYDQLYKSRLESEKEMNQKMFKSQRIVTNITQRKCIS